jgi:hypothetical protein
MTTYCYVVCMQNSTSTILKSNGPCHNGSLAVYVYNSPVMNSITMPACCGTPNRRERRKHQDFKQQRNVVLTTEEKAQAISDKIDKDFLGLENNCYWDAIKLFFERYRYVHDNSGKSPYQILYELNKIDGYIQQAQDRKIIPALAEKNIIFKSLIDILIARSDYFGRFDLRQIDIKGSTIDRLYDEDRMFPSLPQLSRYIGSKIRNMILDKYNSIYPPTRVRPYYQEKQEWFMHTYAACISWRTQSVIHSIALRGFEHPINKISIEMSLNQKYMRAKDIVGNMLVWDVLTGERCNTNNRSFRNQIWLKKELYEEGRDLWGIKFEHADEYHISTCGSKGFFGCNDAETPTLYLYKKPTFYSWLCHIALSNYLCNNDELDALLQSNMLNSLEGFVKDNFKRAIELAKKENDNSADLQYCLD